MEEFERLFAQASHFYSAGQVELALDRANFLLHGEVVPATARWRLYELCALCWYQLGDSQKGAAYYREAIHSTAGLTRERQRKMYSNYLFMLHYLPNLPDAEVIREQFLYNQLFSDVKVYNHEKREKKKLRIGYLSPDFGDHVDVFFLIQLLACYDHSRYEVYCYALRPGEDQTTNQLKGLVDGWENLSGLAASVAAHTIYEDQVDILFDVSGHAGGGLSLRIAAYKPAPIQVLGIGYMSTSGLGAMDYFLTDGYCDPIGQGDEQFFEKLVRLPHTHLCYTPSERALLVKRSYQMHDPIVFGSFNNFAKLTDVQMHVWRRILAAVPGSKLLLQTSQSSAAVLHRMHKRLSQLGFAAGQVCLRPPSGTYLEDYLDMDIALDTYPYPGGGTTCDALYMGVPVVSRYGTRHGSRFGYSLLMNVGLGDLAARTEEEYIARAVALAKDPELLSGLHQNLRRLMEASPLMDGRSYTQAVEAAYEKMWQAWLEG